MLCILVGALGNKDCQPRRDGIGWNELLTAAPVVWKQDHRKRRWFCMIMVAAVLSEEALEGELLLGELLGRPSLEGVLMTGILAGLALVGFLGAIVIVRFLKCVSKQWQCGRGLIRIYGRVGKIKVEKW